MTAVLLLLALQPDPAKSEHGRIEPTGILGSRRWRQADAVTAVAFTPDGKRLLSGAADGSVKCFDIDSGLEHWRRAYERAKVSLAVSPDGRRVLVCLRSSSQLLSLPDGQADGKWKSPAVATAAWSPDGKTLAATEGKKLTLWNLESLEATPAMEAPIGSLAFSPDGSLLAIGGQGSVELWEVRTRRLRTSWKGHRGLVTWVAFAANAEYVFSASDDPAVETRFPNGTLHSRWELPAGWTPVCAMKPQGDYLYAGDASGQGNREILEWSVRNGKVGRTLPGEGFNTTALAHSPTHFLLVSGSSTNVLWRWSHVEGKTETGPGHRGAVLALSTLLKGATVLTAGWDGRLLEWDVASGKAVEWCREKFPVSAVASSPDGKLVLSGMRFQGLWAWTGGKPAKWDGHQGELNAIAFTPDGSHALAGDTFSNLVLWDRSGRSVAKWKIEAISLAISTDRVLVGDSRSRVHVWDLKTGPVAEWQGHGYGYVTGVALHPDGRLALSGGYDGNVILWDVREGKPRFKARANSMGTTRVAFLGSFGVCASEHGTLQLWDLEKGAVIDTIVSDGRPTSLAVDGDRVFVGNADSTVTIYRVAAK